MLFEFLAGLLHVMDNHAPAAADDAAETDADTPVDIHVLANDYDAVPYV